MSRASWSKRAEAGSGVTARNWSSPVSSGTGAGPRGSGPRRRGAACCWTAPARGSRTARSGCLRGCLKCCCLSAREVRFKAEWRIYVVGDRTSASSLPAGAERVLQPTPTASPPLPPRQLPPRQPAFQQPRRWAPGLPSARHPRYPKGPPCPGRRRSTSLNRPMICGGRGSTFRRTYSAASRGS